MVNILDAEFFANYVSTALQLMVPSAGSYLTLFAQEVAEKAKMIKIVMGKISKTRGKGFSFLSFLLYKNRMNI